MAEGMMLFDVAPDLLAGLASGSHADVTEQLLADHQPPHAAHMLACADMESCTSFFRQSLVRLSGWGRGKGARALEGSSSVPLQLAHTQDWAH
eukprot:scaffold239550_cov17-Tisochrysis_lutea.AAC.1